jgi:hypothetical protein
MFSIWTLEGRRETHNRNISSEELQRLKDKRVRQLKNLLCAVKNPNKRERYSARLNYLRA